MKTNIFATSFASQNFITQTVHFLKHFPRRLEYVVANVVASVVDSVVAGAQEFSFNTEKLSVGNIVLSKGPLLSGHGVRLDEFRAEA